MREYSVEELKGSPERPFLQTSRLAIIASWAEGPRVTRSLSTLISELTANDYQVVLSRASDDTRELVWPVDPPADLIVLRRGNSSYDFGSWADALAMFPEVKSAPYVVLANDSLVGPFGSLKALLSDFETRDSDAWGAVMNPQIFPHIQSFFIGFRDGILGDPVLAEFWAGVRPQHAKLDYIEKYELGLNRALFSESYVVDAAFGDKSTGYAAVNPSLDRWRELLMRGFPFIKRAIFFDTDEPRRAEEATAYLRERFGIDVQDWL